LCKFYGKDQVGNLSRDAGSSGRRRASAYLPGTAWIDFRSAASRVQLCSAIMRWPAVASFGTRARQAALLSSTDPYADVRIALAEVDALTSSADAVEIARGAGAADMTVGPLDVVVISVSVAHPVRNRPPTIAAQTNPE